MIIRGESLKKTLRKLSTLEDCNMKLKAANALTQIQEFARILKHSDNDIHSFLQSTVNVPGIPVS